MSVWSSSGLCPRFCGWTVGQCANTCGGERRVEPFETYIARLRASEETEHRRRTDAMLQERRLAREAKTAEAEHQDE